jgi:hypothetical protein
VIRDRVRVQRDDIPKCSFTTASSVDPAGVIAALHEDGVAVIRGLLPKEDVAFLRGAITEWFRARVDDLRSGRLPADEFHFLLSNGLSGAVVQDYNSHLFTMLGRSRFCDYAHRYFGDVDLVVPTPHLLFRVRNDDIDQHMMAGGSEHAFHQDHDLIPGEFPLNAWLPLTDVDDRCSGLFFVLPYKKVVHQLPLDIEGYINSNDGFVWAPNMTPGDVVLFHRHTIHGSFFQRGLPNTRMSVEFRIGRRADSPESYRQALWGLCREERMNCPGESADIGKRRTGWGGMWRAS